MTPIIWYDWFVNSFVYFGITFLMPITLAKLRGEEQQDESKEDLISITIAALGELPAIIFASFLVNVPWFGRKNSLGISFTVGGIAGILT